MARVITCNKCGKRLDEWDIQEEFRFYGRLGYGTTYDGNSIELDLCCECMEELIDSCAISPIVENYITKGGD